MKPGPSIDMVMGGGGTGAHWGDAESFHDASSQQTLNGGQAEAPLPGVLAAEAGWTEMFSWAICILVLIFLGNRLLISVSGEGKARYKSWRGEPFSGQDVEACWVRILYGVLGLLCRMQELSVFKVPRVFISSVIFFAGKVPFYLRSKLAQRGRRVWKDVAYGPRPRNRLDVYLPDPVLAAAAGHPKYGRTVIMMVRPILDHVYLCT